MVVYTDKVYAVLFHNVHTINMEYEEYWADLSEMWHWKLHWNFLGHFGVIQTQNWNTILISSA